MATKMTITPKERFLTRGALILGVVALVVGIGGRMMGVTYPVSSPDFFSGFGTVMFLFGLFGIRRERQEHREGGRE